MHVPWRIVLMQAFPGAKSLRDGPGPARRTRSNNELVPCWETVDVANYKKSLWVAKIFSYFSGKLSSDTVSSNWKSRSGSDTPPSTSSCVIKSSHIVHSPPGSCHNNNNNHHLSSHHHSHHHHHIGMGSTTLTPPGLHSVHAPYHPGPPPPPSLVSLSSTYPMTDTKHIVSQIYWSAASTSAHYTTQRQSS